MNLIEISKNIKQILNDFQVRELPNYPNIAGIMEQSEIVFAIRGGSFNRTNSGDLVNLDLGVMLACSQRTIDDELEVSTVTNLYTLITLIIAKLHTRVIPGCGRITLKDFDNLTPESGKWRCSMSFVIPAYLTFPEDDDSLDPLLEKVEYQYV